MKRVMVNLKEEQYEQLKAIGDLMQLSVSQLLREMLNEMFYGDYVKGLSDVMKDIKQNIEEQKKMKDKKKGMLESTKLVYEIINTIPYEEQTKEVRDLVYDLATGREPIE